MIEIQLNGQSVRVYAEKIDGVLWVHHKGRTFTYEEKSKTRKMSDQAKGNGKILAPMPGKIIQVIVKNGDEVRRGQVLLTLEAMKMEYNLSTDKDGVVADLNCIMGQQVKQGQVLASVIDSEH